jgi:miniconductance mechanosensitive channel
VNDGETHNQERQAADDATNGIDGETAAEDASVGEVDEPVDTIGLVVDEVLRDWLGWMPQTAWMQSLIVLTLLLLVAWLAHLIARRYVVRIVGVAMKRLPSWWAGVVVDYKVLYRLVPLVPVMIVGRGIAFVPHLPDALVEVIQRLAQATVVLLIALAIGAVLNVVNIIYNRYPVAQGRPIKGYLQVAKLVIYIAAGILIVSALMAESPWVFLTGLGAMTAIIMLIFRDTLLSLVAGIQLVNNDLVRVGDWIEMPQFNADGDVIDISLNVVQVRNWDKTITVIPTHKFLEHSFKNWRGMFDVGGRRISRPVYIDMTTIRFLTEEEVRRFSRFRLLRDYIASKVTELDEYNRKYCADDDAEIVANARHLTNIGTFRAYVLEYLKHHPLVHQEFTTLVRQLEPGPHGLPLQIWTHIKDTRWPIYEGAQADIFDHILAVAPEFGLRIFQEPTGYDLAQLRPRRTQTAGRNGEP